VAAVCGVNECIRDGQTAQEMSRSDPAARACGDASPSRCPVDRRQVTGSSTGAEGIVIRGVVIAGNGFTHLIRPPSRLADAGGPLGLCDI
jgi:hypothetical protein